MSDAFQDSKGGGWNRGKQIVRDTERGTNILVAIEQQGWDVDAR
jgi:hypothetical protein